MPRQDAVHRGARDGDLVEPTEVGRDSARAEVIVLAQVEDLADHIARRRAWRPVRRSRAIPQAGVAMLGVSPLPLVERLAGNSEPPAHASDISLLAGRSQHP